MVLQLWSGRAGPPSSKRWREAGSIFRSVCQGVTTQNPLRDVSFLLHVVPEIIEDTNEVAIKIGGHKLAQLPRFIRGFGDDLGVRGVPLCEEFVYLGIAIEIEPEKDRAFVAVGLSEGLVGDKQSAIPL